MRRIYKMFEINEVYHDFFPQSNNTTVLSHSNSKKIQYKMKYSILSLLFILPLFSTAQIDLPAASPGATVKQMVGLANVTIEYSRPALKGRKMIGSSLIPYGKIWRTGANKLPNLTIDKEVKIEGQALPAGTYGIATIPNLNSWTIIISKNPNQFGTFEYKESEDLLRFAVKAQKVLVKEEYFTMGFSDFNETTAHLFIKWENALVKCKITHDPHEQILAQIKEKTGTSEVSSDTYYSAAEYYYDKNIDLNQALAWADKVVAADKQYWTYNLRGKIAAKLGKCDLAVSDANEGLVLAKRDNDPSYILMLQKILTSCKGK